MVVERCPNDDDDDVMAGVGEFIGLMGVLESYKHDDDARRSCEERRRRAVRRRRSVQMVLGLIACSLGAYVVGYERQFYLTLLLFFVRGVWRQYMEGRFGMVALEGVAFMLFAVACAGAGLAFTLEYGIVEKDMDYYHTVAALCTNEATRTKAEGSQAGKMLCANATEFLGSHVVIHVFNNLYKRGLVSVFFNGSPSDLYCFITSGTGLGGWAFGLAVVAITVVALGSSIIAACTTLCLRRSADPTTEVGALPEGRIYAPNAESKSAEPAATPLKA